MQTPWRFYATCFLRDPILNFTDVWTTHVADTTLKHWVVVKDLNCNITTLGKP